jgi:hypothetical protein
MNNNHSTRNLGNVRKTPMWGNPREREIYIASGKYISAEAIQFLAREKYLTTPKTVPTFCFGKRAQKYLYGMYDQLNNTKKRPLHQQKPLENLP